MLPESSSGISCPPGGTTPVVLTASGDLIRASVQNVILNVDGFVQLYGSFEFDKYSDSEIIDRLITRNKDELFFTKAKDWETEFEYRLVVPTAGMEPLPVYVRDALRVVMLGELVGKEYTPSIVALLDEPGVKELEIRILRVLWQDGAPYLRDPTAFGYS